MADKETKRTADELKDKVAEAVKAERARIKELMQTRAKTMYGSFSPVEIAAVKALNDFASYL